MRGNSEEKNLFKKGKSIDRPKNNVFAKSHLNTSSVRVVMLLGEREVVFVDSNHTEQLVVRNQRIGLFRTRKREDVVHNFDSPKERYAELDNKHDYLKS